MRGSKIVAFVAAVILFVGLGARAAYADQANGSYSFNFSGLVALWDIAGSYSGDLGEFDLAFSITEQPSGKLTGDGTFSVAGESLEGTISSVGGKMSGSSTDPHVALDLRMSGKGTVSGTKVRVSVSANLHYDLDSAAGNLDHGTGSGTVTVTDLSTGQTESESGTFRPSAIPILRLPDDSTGDWSMSLDLTPNGDKYSGTATIETSTGVTADFTVKGSYDSSADTSKLALDGVGGKLDMVISTSGTTLNVATAKGKLFGQKINYKAQ